MNISPRKSLNPGRITYLTALVEGLPTLVNSKSYVRNRPRKIQVGRLILQALKLTDAASLPMSPLANQQQFHEGTRRHCSIGRRKLVS